MVLYEAVLSHEQDGLEHALFPDYDPEYAEHGRHTLEKRAQASGVEWIDVLVDAALRQVFEYALGNLYVYAYPDIAYSGDYLTVDRLTRSWGARNLLGAMGLQWYWLITSAGEVSRCKHCGQIISYAPPMLAKEDRKARKPRRDKEFCSTRCRQNYHYQHRTKPKRQKKAL